MNSFSAHTRQSTLEEMSRTHFDVLIIGGGITGAGIALDATARGLKVALIEMQDFASGTSGRSTKLIHGGLRYLKQLDFKLVAEVGTEREIIHRIAPHLTKPEPMLLPICKNGSMSMFTARLGMWLYEFLAGVKKNEKHKTLNRDACILKEPLLKKDGLLGGILFYEYRTDDARLTFEVLKEAHARGAKLVNYLKATAFIYKGTEVNGVFATDSISETTYRIQADFVVNAGGPWVDEIDALERSGAAQKLHLTKGIHLVVDQKKLPIHQAAYFDTSDKRMIFVIPRDKKTYIGTTDTFYKGDLRNPEITEEDKAYLLQHVNAFFPENKLTMHDIESGWSGLRPLIQKPGKGPSEISRKDETFLSPSGLITIAGGKLTGYRKMAQRVVDRIAKEYHLKHHKKLSACTTDQIAVSGGNTGKNMPFTDYLKTKLPQGLEAGFTAQETEKVIQLYGSNVDAIFRIADTLKQEPSTLPLQIRAQIIYAMEYEMCINPVDFFIRRSSLLYFDISLVKKINQDALEYMKNRSSWSEKQYLQYQKELTEHLNPI